VHGAVRSTRRDLELTFARIAKVDFSDRFGLTSLNRFTHPTFNKQRSVVTENKISLGFSRFLVQICV
jgi:hypothetical protein